MPDFLLEIGCEEIPARMIDAASRELRERLNSLLQRERLEPAGAISVTERVGVIARVRTLAVGIAKAWMDQQYSTEKQSEKSGEVPRPAAREKKGKFAPVAT